VPYKGTLTVKQNHDCDIAKNFEKIFETIRKLNFETGKHNNFLQLL